MVKRAPIWLALLLLSGCSWFSWLPFVDGDDSKKKNKENTKPAALVKFDAEVKVDRLWRSSVGQGMGRKYLRIPPAVIADQIVAADGYGLVEAFDRFSGKRQWRARIGELEGGFFKLGWFDRKDPSFVSGGVGSGDGKVFLGMTDGVVVALSAADGSEVWRGDVGSEVLSAPAYGAGQVYTQTIDGRLLALDAESGEVIWSFDNQVPVLTLRGTSTPVFDQGVVYTGFASGKVSAVRADNGEPVWESRIMLPEGRSELERMVDVDARPLVRGGLLLAVSYQGRIKALRRTDGQAIWEREMSSFLNLAEGYGQVYVASAEDAVIALDIEAAEEAWRQDALARRRLTSPVAYSNYTLVGDGEGYLHVLAQSDGRFLARRKVDSDGLRSAPVIVDSVIYVLGNSGSLTAFEITEK
ncbi:MAG: outer membrane protein assembly factor BamB [Pseudomonadales bacterium]